MLMRMISSSPLDCTFMLSPVYVTVADRGPSPPEELKQALEYAHDPRSNPLDPNSREKFLWHLGCISWFPI